MKRRAGVLLMSWLAVSAGCTENDGGRVSGPSVQGSAGQSTQPGRAGDTIPDRWIVVLAAQADPTAIQQQTLHSFGGRVHHTYVAALRGFAADLPPAAVAALRANPHVSYVEPDRWGGVVATQTNATWGLDRIDQRSLPLSTTYTYNRTGAGVNVYVLDTGVRRTHSDFGNRAAYIPNGRNGDFVFDSHGNTSGAADCHGHGTHVAGTAGGSTWGVAKSVRIWAGRVVDCLGNGTASTAIAGVDWVRMNGVRPAVTNMSLSYGDVQSLRTAVQNAIAAGFNFAVSAGNGNGSGTPINACFNSPSGAADAVTVGATNSTDSEASWSNYGPCVDVLAPGVNVTSAWATGDNATRIISGTSMSAPHVAGVIALYLEANPNATPAAVATALRTNATQGVINLHTASRNGGTPNLLLYSGFITGPQQAPAADFQYSCANRTCGFHSTSTDADGTIVSWSWNLGDGTTASVPSPDHTFAVTGTFTVKLTVTDNHGLTSTKSAAVQVATGSNVPPTANFRTVVSGLTANFTDMSTDADGSIASRSWRFGDGATSTATSPTHSYPAAGKYLVTLEVTDNAGSRHWQTLPVTVGGANAVPIASFTFPCSGNSCTFTDYTSDSDGSIVSRTWFLGDGSTAGAHTVTHAFAATGVYDVTLKVIDNLGAEHWRTRQVSVTASSSNQPPVADFASSCSALLCAFIDASTDPDGQVVSRLWNFGDGTASTALDPVHTFAAAGNRTVSLTVTDNAGATHTRSISVSVPATGSLLPVPNWKVSCSGLACSFTNLSADADGAISARLWDFGDGTTSTASNTAHTFPSAGTRNVTLRVTDNSGKHAWLAIPVNVGSSNQTPFASFTFPCAGRTCSFTDFSSDNDGTVVSWHWDFRDGTTSTTRNPVHTFAAPGTYYVTLTVVDNAGAVHRRVRAVTVT